MYKFIQNSQGLIRDGDIYAKQQFEKWGSVMSPQAITINEIDAIFDQLEGPLNMEDTISFVLEDCGINPASVKTIWNTKFNNTNLATKEFEARMPWIHKSCNEAVLQLYINNLDKPLSEVDAMVVDLTSGEVKAKFKAFENQNDGLVEISESSTKELSDYFKIKQKAEALALTKTKHEFWESEREKDSKQIEAEGKSVAREIENRTEVLQKEYKKNLCKVYDELDYPQDCNRPPTAPAYYSVNVSATGWNNIDKQVYSSTVNREKTTFSYEGKTSTLIYNEWTGIVKDYTKFSRINMYNIPKEFRSYIKLYGDKGKYTYKLNADIDYQTVVLAWTENDLYYGFEETTVTVKSEFTLNKVSQQEFKTTIKNSLGHINNMSAEMDFIVSSQKDQKRVNANVKRKELTNKIRPFVFPCNCGVDGGIGEEVTPILDVDIF
jgi:hypothetical protein